MSEALTMEREYSPEELRLADWCLRAEQEAIEARQAAQAAQPAETAPTVETFDIERFAPWDFRVCNRLARWFSLGSRDGITDAAHRPLWLWRRAVLWCLTTWPRFRLMLWILRSGDVNEDIYAERWGACEACTELKIGRDGEGYCGSCGCIDWRKSRLTRKNRCRFNHCPARKHAGGYIKLITAQWPNRKEPTPAPRRGCGANGNG